MEKYKLENYDVIVIGAGHAGCEAALASARLGKKTAVFVLSLDTIANMPCNPCIGGSAKGQLVCEIDALGGQMGKTADQTFIQSRMLNRGKGPAVHSLRVQSDRMKYHSAMKHELEMQENLDIKQGEVTAVIVEDGKITGVETKLGAIYGAKCVIITTGTYLNGAIHIGETSFPSGPDSIAPAIPLSESLKALGLNIRRFKTGTPARVHRRSIDFSVMEEQDGDEDIIPFSFDNKLPLENKTKCYITYTNERTHKVILDNLDKSPLYSGRIHGVGPRYCPSIEDKIVRFKDKERHQLFVEPMGLDTDEYYLQGMSTSLPEYVQLEFLRTIKGLEQVEIMRPAYAIEYDCCDPLELYPSLEFKKISGLFGAGQFNCTSGYEEAAAQGLIAGINASRKLDNLPPLILDRASSYIGTLIDDLVTKGCVEPYRMMTSRSEYRLILRQDNAPERLTEIGHEVGLISEERYSFFLDMKNKVDSEIERIKTATIHKSDALNKMLTEKGTSPLDRGARFIELLKRPQISYNDIKPFDESAPDLPPEIINKVEINVKYEGYIKTQLEQIEQMRKLESKLLPTDVDYREVKGLRLEAQEKLNKHKPLNIGQAGRISGVNPADVSVLLIWLAGRNKND
ncbi:MAG: tRNA uridine-5-carboxymethylaminomethyl(34) synthesis enzyme MnmG [Ruminiclostridium sp.]